MRLRFGNAFTIIELVVVIAILGILAALALPRMATLHDEAATAQAEGMNGGFSSAIQLVHAKWIGQGEGTTVTVAGVDIDVNALGWPAPAGGGFMTQAFCADLWRNLLSTPPPIAVGYTPGTDGWGALAGGVLCGFVYEPDVTPIRLIIYDASDGSVELFLI